MDVDYASAFGVIGVREPGGHVGVPHHGEQFYGLISVCHRAVLPSGLAPHYCRTVTPAAAYMEIRRVWDPVKKSGALELSGCVEACGER